MQEIVAFLGGSTILLVAVAWLIRSLTAHFLDKDAEKYKELVRAEVARNSRLYEERGVVLRDIYANLVDLLDKTESFVHPASFSGEPSKEEKQMLVADAFLNFRNHFNCNKIYLSPEVCSRIEEFRDVFIEPAAKFAMYRGMSKDGKDPSVAQEFYDSWLAAYDSMRDKVPGTKEALENEFRKLIGTIQID